MEARRAPAGGHGMMAVEGRAAYRRITAAAVAHR